MTIFSNSKFGPVLCLAAMSVTAMVSGAQSSAVQPITALHAARLPAELSVQSMSTKDVLHIIVGQSLILRGVSPMRRIYVGNPNVLQTFTSDPEEVVVTAKAAGSSSLVIWDADGQSKLYTVSADIDPSRLRKSLDSEYPNNVIEVNGEQDRIELTGSVPTADVSAAVVKLAAMYAKDVVNSLRVVPVRGKQVQLKLRIVEVDRTKLEQFGINFFRQQGNVVNSTSTGMYPSTLTLTQGASGVATSVLANNPLNVFLYNFGHGIGVTAQDLEQAHVLQILAEPTLTTMSGQAARFLSGGEFPVPIAQSGTGGAVAITIEFKSYGVKVDFTPTVNGDGSIRLKIAPEVSTLDFANAVTISGFTIPALATRRAETEVEIKDGQSFVLSGLLDHTVTDTFSKIPGIANIPILGQLFKSKNMSHAVTELVIMVTATVVDPVNDGAAVPEPKFIVPTLENKKFDQNIQKLEKVAPPADNRE